MTEPTLMVINYYNQFDYSVLIVAFVAVITAFLGSIWNRIRFARWFDAFSSPFLPNYFTKFKLLSKQK